MCSKWILVTILSSAMCGVAVCVPHQYHFVNENKNWTEAQSYCRQTYTDLATFNNMEEINTLLNTLPNNPAYLAWIGLVDWPWKWQWSLRDGNFFTGKDSYSNWNAGEPNNVKGIEHCVIMNKLNTLWYDAACGIQYPFVCFKENNVNDRTYTLINIKKKWDDAQSYCRQYYTDLANVRNQSENQQVQNAIQQANNNLVWIGLFRDSWTWSDQSSLSYTNWNQGQPDNSGGNENCAAMSTTDGRWHDAGYANKFPFICYENTLILINQSLTWREALTYCRENYVDLVSVYSADIQGWVREVAQKASTEHVWMGMSYAYTLDKWYWVSGKSSRFQNWAPGYGTGEEDCRNGYRTGAVQSRGNQQWVSLPGTERLNFICTTYED